MNVDPAAALAPPDGQEPPHDHPAPARAGKIHRRSLLMGAGAAAVGAVGFGWARRALREHAAVFIASGQRYAGPLATTIRDGLLATGFDPATLRGKRVLLKPNLVEPTRVARHMTTHPAMIVAAAEVFRGWGAAVSVGEGPGHVRDTEMALEESGLGEAFQMARLPFADLNYEDTVWVPNRGRASQLKGFHLPHSVVSADLIVSLPKMKTHHLIGVTAAMKNLYGVLPGIRYGWPKNVLHQNGIPETVYDINASLPKTIAIVDGIECMEGDGPIMGTPKHMGLVVVGTVPAAVDATVARLMYLCPEKIGYLCLAADRLGPIDDRYIDQRGELWRPLASAFQIIDQPHLQSLRVKHG
ncbi:MAG: DUF362 domain-containing protein [Planctomycetota bacterium]|nr:DUF362 domain-containing protein [Planctomycetota bacterium]